jgi:hypothetical protein
VELWEGRRDDLRLTLLKDVKYLNYRLATVTDIEVGGVLGKVKETGQFVIPIEPELVEAFNSEICGFLYKATLWSSVASIYP